MGDFFGPPPGLALFLNAGDPPLDVLGDVVHMLDERGVDCLELGVPFPDSVTDGPVIRRSAERALADGVGLDEVLAFVGDVQGSLARLRIVVFADWSHTVRPHTLDRFTTEVAASGAAGALLHGVPPRVRPAYYEAAAHAGMPVVTTCYAQSSPDVLAEAARHVSAYVYLVAHYGKSGVGTAPAADAVRAPIAALRARTDAPIAVGFGVRAQADVARVHALGADAAVVGTAGVACVEASRAAGGDVVADLARWVTDLHPQPTPQTGAPQ
jgi:tryptophan synthase alpha chain